MTVAGVLVQSTPQAHWAWVGVRLEPETGYDDVEEPGLRADLAAVDRAWLAGLWTTEHGARWELRYVNERSGMPLTCVLLGRVHARSVDEVTAAALELRERLVRAPRHVRAEPILAADQVGAYLKPSMDPMGSFELRKPLRWEWRQRPEPGHRVWFEMSPLVASGRSWQQFWSELARLPAPTTVGVYLEPCQPSVGFYRTLRELAAKYARAGAGRQTSVLWKLDVAGDPAAAAAASACTEAARRYAYRPFWLRVSVACAAPLDPGFAELLGVTAGGAVVCRTAPGDIAGMWRNVAALNRDWLDETYRLGAPDGELGETERNMSSLVDVTEALAAFRLPYEAAGRQPLFSSRDKPMPEPIVTDGPGRKKVFISYVREDIVAVDRLADALRAEGYDVWIDHQRLLPGMRWKNVIKKAINDGHCFVACFSPRYWKAQSFMNEELIVAVERLRLMPRDRMWFIPVMLEKTELPDFGIGPGETLVDMQYADFASDWEAGLAMVTTALGPPDA